MKSNRLIVVIVLFCVFFVSCDEGDPFGFLSPQKYTVFYHGNGNTGGSVPVDTLKYSAGDAVVVFNNDGNLEKTGFSLAGWNTAIDGSGTTYPGGSMFIMPEGGVTLYAFWVTAAFEVRYNANGADGGSAPNDDETYIEGDAAIAAGPGTLSRAGFIFDGWNTVADGSGTDYAVGNEFVISDADVTLYAQWTEVPTFSVTYNGNESVSGTVPTDTTEYEEGAIVIVEEAETLARPEYEYTGWNTAADGSGVAYAAGETFTMPAADVTLFAQWVSNPTFEVTYASSDSDGGDIPTDATEYAVNATVTVSGPGTMTWTDHYFAGWNTEEDGSGDSYIAGDTFAMPAANLTLFAQWTTDPVYFVIYDGNESNVGVVPSDDTAYLEGETVTVLDEGTMDRSDYEFSGWNTEDDGTGTAYEAGDTFVIGTSDVTLHAQWRAWDKKIHGNTEDRANDVAVDPVDGSVYVVGYGMELVGATNADWWILKFTEDGQQVGGNWENLQFDGNGGHDHAMAVSIGSDQSVYIAGRGQNLVGASSNYDWWIKKYSSGGLELWQLKIDSGSDEADHAYDILVNAEGDGIEYVYVSGIAWNIAGGGNYDIWIKKFDTDGNEITAGWDKKISANDPDYATALAASSAHIYMAGRVGGNWWIKKFDRSTGGEITSGWNKAVENGAAYGIEVGADGSVYVAGYDINATYDWAVRKFNADGNDITTGFPAYIDGNGGHDYLYGMEITADDELYLVGVGNSLLGTGNDDFWVRKIASDGTLLWDRRYDSGNGHDQANGVAVTPDGSSVYVVGYGSYLVPSGGEDMWIKKFNSEGIEQ